MPIGILECIIYDGLDSVPVLSASVYQNHRFGEPDIGYWSLILTLLQRIDQPYK